MMGTEATIVMVARTDSGVIRFCWAPLAPEIIPSMLDCPEVVLEFCRIFCSSYCSVLNLMWEELYRNTSNQEFHWNTPENKATVANTGVVRGSTILVKVTKSPAPSIRPASRMLSGRFSMKERIIIRLNTPISPGQI
ncbi:hypothetical protein D3C81_1921640 [compost metagenome]